jgi:phosphoglycolate phosphatase
MAYKAVLFDLDGTLLNTLVDIGTCANNALAENGFPTHELDAYRDFVGEGALMLFQRALPEAHREDAVALRTCLRTFMVRYQTAEDLRATIYDGVAELLDGLTRRGLKLTILSNKPHVLTQKVVAAKLAAWEFSVVLGQRDTVPRKPDPAGALEIAATLGIPPGEFLYLGDTGIDMKTATAAGMFPVGALWGFRGREELLEGGAKTLIQDPRELLDLGQIGERTVDL